MSSLMSDGWTYYFLLVVILIVRVFQQSMRYRENILVLEFN